MVIATQHPMMLTGFKASTKPENVHIPLQDFFKNPEQTNFQVSHNAKYIASLRPWNNRLNIFVQQLSEDRLPIGEVKQVTFSKDRDIRSYIWKGDNNLIYRNDFAGDEKFHLYAIDLTTGEDKDLTPLQDGSINDIFATNTGKPTEILINSNRRNKECFDIYRLNIETGETEVVATNKGKIFDAIADHKGVVRVIFEVDGNICKMSSRESNDEEFKVVLKYSYEDKITPLIFSTDNKFLYASSNIGRDKRAIVKIDPNSGREIQEIFSHTEVDVGEIRYSRKQNKLLAAVLYTSRQNFEFFDSSAKERISKIKAKLGNLQIYNNSANKNEDLLTVITTDDKGWAAYLYDVPKDRLTLLYDTAQYLSRNKLANTQPISYTARDGTLIHGYLTLPINSTSKNLPIVIHPHGGPYNIRDYWEYSPTVQFLANRGYGVLQINYRGSHGYGKEFYKKSFREWGRAMQDDLTCGVEYLIDKGIADPKRIGIYGVSYGGYCALAGAAFTPDLYACAVDFVGPSNMFTFFETLAEHWAPLKHIWIDRIGDPIKDKELLESISPLFHVDKIKIPIFVIHGSKDPRVNKNESDQIVSALQKTGVPVEYMVKENEGHGFSNQENIFEFFTKLEQFLDTHLKKSHTLNNVAAPMAIHK